MRGTCWWSWALQAHQPWKEWNFRVKLFLWGSCLPLLVLGSCSFWTHFVHFRTYFCPFRGLLLKHPSWQSLCMLGFFTIFGKIRAHLFQFLNIFVCCTLLPSLLVLSLIPLRPYSLVRSLPLTMALRAFKPGGFTCKTKSFIHSGHMVILSGSLTWNK